MPRARKPALGYRWHLRRLMADAGLYATTELTPLLAERGIVLSQAQVYRLVTGTPERLSLRTLVALCDILGCTPNQRRYAPRLSSAFWGLLTSTGRVRWA